MPCVGRRFKPLPNETLVLKSRTYTIRPHPMAPTSPFAAEGRRAVVYNLQDGAGAKWALKVFRRAFRVSSLVDSAALVGQYQHLPGMIAARRTVIAPGDEAAVECPDLAYSTLMPWIEGNTWYDLLLNPSKFRPQYDHGASLRICGTFLKVMEGLEHAGLTHTDIAPGNVSVNLNTLGVQLLDLEDIYVAGIAEPDVKNMGSSGYQHPSAEAGKSTWCAEGDRYATAVMAAEMLLFANPDTESFSSDSGLFGGDRNTSTGTQRFNATFPYLQSVAPHFAELFRSAWMSETLDACPLASQLSQAIAKVPLPPTFRWEPLTKGPQGHITQPSSFNGGFRIPTPEPPEQPAPQPPQPTRKPLGPLGWALIVLAGILLLTGLVWAFVAASRSGMRVQSRLVPEQRDLQKIIIAPTIGTRGTHEVRAFTSNGETSVTNRLVTGHDFNRALRTTKTAVILSSPTRLLRVALEMTATTGADSTRLRDVVMRSGVDRAAINAVEGPAFAFSCSGSNTVPCPIAF